MRFFPLLLIAVIIYNILAFGTGPEGRQSSIRRVERFFL